ncbi:MAG: hypothetical protein J6W88_03730 [Bacteroidales bacterium]|nr:hypothetical protein [Bacteroidales bacterium]
MSLSDEERRIIVDLEIEKAYRTYDAAMIIDLQEKILPAKEMIDAIAAKVKE